MDEMEFRRHAEQAMESLKKQLIAAEANSDFEVEEAGGVIYVSFDEPPAKFVVTTNTPVRQIWISARGASFKLDWSRGESAFVLSKTGEKLSELLTRLIDEQLQEAA